MKTLNVLHEELKQNSSTICAFHIGRGGRFYSPGFRKFLDFKGVGDYTNDLFIGFESDLGEEIYLTGNGNQVGLTVKEAESGIGSINIDNDYNTTYTCRLTDCDDNELQLIHDSFLFDTLNSDEQMYVNLSLGIEEETESE